MSLRRYISSDYVLSLFAGVRTATTAPPGTYSTGTQDDLGRGACGVGVDPDAAVSAPTITALAAHTLVEPTDTISASAFSATGGLTHRSSRWFIEECSGGALGSPADLICPITPAPLASDPVLGSPYYSDPDQTNTWYCVPVSAGSTTMAYGWSVSNETSWPGVSFPDGTYDTHTGTLDYPVGSGAGTVVPEVADTPPTCSGGQIVYDSGASTVHLTTLPLSEAHLQPGHSYRIRVRYQANNGGCGAYSEWVSFIMSDTCLDCPELPAPPPPAPPPAPAPVPAPPPPTDDGFNALSIDFANSFLLGDLGCLDNAIGFPAIFSQNGKYVGLSGSMSLLVTNMTHSPASGTIQVTADNSGLAITPACGSATSCTISGTSLTISVPKFSSVRVGFGLRASVSGRYVVTIDTGSGTPTTFNFSATGQTDCGGGA